MHIQIYRYEYLMCEYMQDKVNGFNMDACTFGLICDACRLLDS